MRKILPGKCPYVDHLLRAGIILLSVISKPGLHSVYKTVIDSMGHSGSWLSRSSSSRTLSNLTTRDDAKYLSFSSVCSRTRGSELRGDIKDVVVDGVGVSSQMALSPQDAKAPDVHWYMILQLHGISIYSGETWCQLPNNVGQPPRKGSSDGYFQDNASE
ncbi:hypothetical protein Tco_0992981 [Tanacetum coccineum]|uniref:Uncharacterized protein n=1 Tax=Tanacetum coccineum TaxID=301880 RepID=A0ABQ5F5E3_9ASTR